MSAVDRAAAVREVAAWSAPILVGTGIAPGTPVDPDAHPAGSAVQAWAAAPMPATLAASLPFLPLTAAGLALVALVSLGALALRQVLRSQTVRKGLTWDCGYAQPTSRMQYTGSSLGNSLVELTSSLLWPKKFRAALSGLFPRSSAFKSLVPDVVLDRLVAPVFRLIARILPRLRVLQQGQTHVYVLYILLVMIVLLVWGNLRSPGL